MEPLDTGEYDPADVFAVQIAEPRQMTSVHPLVDLLWLRYLLAWMLLIIVPGFLLIGRQLRSVDLLTRFYASWAAGMVTVPIAGFLFGWLHLPLQPTTYAGFVLTALVAIHFVRRGAQPRILDLPAASGLFEQLAVVAAAVFIVGISVWAFRDYVAPPHVHDATNHSFLTLRIVETKSTVLSRIYGEPWGSPTAAYLVGWHVSAALISQLSGLAPYVATWYTPVLALGILPIACAVYWRWLGLPTWCIVGGVLLLPANRTFPLAALEWGGMGILMGMTLAPFVALLTLRAIERGTLTVSALAALSLGALVHVHMSSAMAALVLVVIGLFRHEFLRTMHFRWSALLIFLVVLFAVAGYENFHLLREYQTKRLAPPSRELLAIPQAVSSALEAVGELRWMKWIALVGLASSLVSRRTRGLAIASLLLTALYVAMCSFRDPFSQAVSQVFYQQPSRVRALQMFLLPPLLSVPLWFVWQHTRIRILRWVPVAIMAGITAQSVDPAVRVHLRRIQGPGIHGYVPFSADDFALAQRVREVVDPDDWIANTWDDGSAWTFHVSRRQFVIPTGWVMGEREGRNYRTVVPLLLEEPWPRDVQALRERGVRYVYASDTVLPGSPNPGFTRERFARDARFESILEGKDSALYWIAWDDSSGAQVIADAVRYGRGWKAPERWGRWAMERQVTLEVDVPSAPSMLRLRCAPFQGQLEAQRCNVRVGGQQLGSFEIRGTPWEWRSVRVPLPATLQDSTIEITLDFSGQWPGSAQDPQLRVCPVQSVEIIQLPRRVDPPPTSHPGGP